MGWFLRIEAVVCLVCLFVLSAAQIGLQEEDGGVGSRSRQLLHTHFQQTRDEFMEEIDCREECRERRRDPVCGTNGQTYTSLCDLHRHVCKRVKVKLKHRGECTLAEMCIDERRAKQELVSHGERVYVPTCLEDGSYSPVQCHNFTSYCWCSRLDGKPIPDTITQDRIPQCKDRTAAQPTASTPPRQGKSLGRRNKGGNTGRRGAEEEDSAVIDTLFSLSTATTPASTTPKRSKAKRCTGRTKRTFITNISQQWIKEYTRERNRRPMSENRLRRKAIKWKFSGLDSDRDGRLKWRELRRLRRAVRKFIKPKKCAKKFPRLCDEDNNNSLTKNEWMKCFTLPKRGRKGDRRCNSASCRSNDEVTTMPPPSCLRYRAESGTSVNDNNSIPVLECQADGRYQPVQCHKNICICVDEWTGSSLDGTGIENGTPDCSRPLPHARIWPGCTGRVKTKFMQDLKKFLLSKVEGGDRTTGPDSAGQSVEQFAAMSHFRSLDIDSNKRLERREWKAVRRLLKTPKLKSCGKNLTRYCDVDRDRSLTEEEWLACVILQNNHTDEPRPIPPPEHRNPFETILKPES